MCFSPPTRNDPKETHKQIFATRPVRDNPANVFIFMCFSFPEYQGGPGAEPEPEMSEPLSQELNVEPEPPNRFSGTETGTVTLG